MEASSDEVRTLVEGAAVAATSVVIYAEVRAALARLRRERALSAAGVRSAKREFERQWPSFLKLDATDALCRTAGERAELYRLRGFDSVHLASFAEVARRAGIRETRFSSVDDPSERGREEAGAATRASFMTGTALARFDGRTSIDHVW